MTSGNNMTSGNKRIEIIHDKLQAALNPVTLDITDDSHLHVGHAGAQDGAGHFTVNIVAESFKDMSTIARHRLIYDALAELMPDQIHALSIKASAPSENGK